MQVPGVGETSGTCPGQAHLGLPVKAPCLLARLPALFLAESKGQVLNLLLPQAIKLISHANSISCALEQNTLRRAPEHSRMSSGTLLALLNNYFSIRFFHSVQFAAQFTESSRVSR